MKRSNISTEKLTLRAYIVRGSGSKKDRTVQIALSSEKAVDRGYYNEILDHSPGSVDLSRINSGSHPLLVDHDTTDQIGVIESAWLDNDRRVRCLVRFGNSDRANEIYQDVMDNIRQLVSVGYAQTGELAQEEDEYGKPTIRFSWMPYEASIVAVPADDTVGVGRSLESRHNATDYYCDRCGSYMAVDEPHHRTDAGVFCSDCIGKLRRTMPGVENHCSHCGDRIAEGAAYFNTETGKLCAGCMKESAHKPVGPETCPHCGTKNGGQIKEVLNDILFQCPDCGKTFDGEGHIL
jgi:ribosomal protein L37AE/L43A